MIDLTMTQEQFVKMFIKSKLNYNYIQACNYDDLRKMMWEFLGTIRAMKGAIEKDEYAGFGVDPDYFDDFLQEYTKNRKYCRNYRYKRNCENNVIRKAHYKQFKIMIELEELAKNGDTDAQDKLRNYYCRY